MDFNRYYYKMRFVYLSMEVAALRKQHIPSQSLRGMCTSADSLVSSSIDRERRMDRLWATSPEARAILASGAGKNLPPKPLLATSMDQFIMRRGYRGADRHKKASLNASANVSLDQEGAYEDAGPAHRSLSAALTFPLSMAYGIDAIFSANSAANNRSCSVNINGAKTSEVGPTLRVLVVGARAEASLPGLWWREALANTALLGRLRQTTSSYLHVSEAFSETFSGASLEVTMVGPSIPPAKPQQTNATAAKSPDSPPGGSTTRVQVAGEDKSCTSPIRTVQLLRHPIGNRLLHDIPDVDALLHNYDFIVMFHPGMGHRTLRDDWRPTVASLLASGKPVICTAHSARDLSRDLLFLSEMEECSPARSAVRLDLEILVPGRSDSMHVGWGSLSGLMPLTLDAAALESWRNPFCSSRRTFDTAEEAGAKVVVTNEFIYAFKGVPAITSQEV